MKIPPLIFTIITAFLIYYLSILPGNVISKYAFLNHKIIFKLGHISGFALLVILLINSFNKSFYKVNKLFVYFTIIAVIITLATYIEIKQKTIYGRESSIIDIGFDILGAFIGFKMGNFFGKLNLFL